MYPSAQKQHFTAPTYICAEVRHTLSELTSSTSNSCSSLKKPASSGPSGPYIKGLRQYALQASDWIRVFLLAAGGSGCQSPASPDVKKAPVPSGAEAGAVPPVGLEPTTFGLKVRSSDQLS